MSHTQELVQIENIVLPERPFPKARKPEELSANTQEFQRKQLAALESQAVADSLPSLDALNRAYEIFDNQDEYVTISGDTEHGLPAVGMPYKSVKMAEVEEGYENTTTVWMGGGICSTHALKAMGLPYAAMGRNVLFLPNPLNHKVIKENVTHQEFMSKIYAQDSQHGAYFAEAYYVYHTLRQLREEGIVGENIRLAGLSNGAAIMLKSMQRLNNDETFNLEDLVLFAPMGTKPTKWSFRILRALQTLGFFIIEGLFASNLFDKDEFMMEMVDVEGQKDGELETTPHFGLDMKAAIISAWRGSESILYKEKNELPENVQIVLAKYDYVSPVWHGVRAAREVSHKIAVSKYLSGTHTMHIKRGFHFATRLLQRDKELNLEHRPERLAIV